MSGTRRDVAGEGDEGAALILPYERQRRRPVNWQLWSAVAMAGAFYAWALAVKWMR